MYMYNEQLKMNVLVMNIESVNNIIVMYIHSE